MAKNKKTKIKGGYFHNGKGKQFTVLQDALANDTKCGCGINCKDGFVSLPSFDSVSGDKEGFHGFYFVDGELVTNTVPNIKEEIKSFCNGPQEPQALRLTFNSIENANLLVGDASNVSDWNTFFDLPTNGNPFTSVEVVGNEVRLFGGSNITLKDSLFEQNNNLIKIIDSLGCVVSCDGMRQFSECQFLSEINLPELTIIGSDTFAYGCTSLITVNLPKILSLESSCFEECSSLISIYFPSVTGGNSSNWFSSCTSLETVNLPLITNIANFSMDFCSSLATINIPSCTNLGSTVDFDWVFNSISGNTITLTVPAALMTANAGSPDGDIAYLQANNTVTVVTV